MSKKIISALLAVAFLVTVCGCSSQNAKSKLCANVWESSVGFLQFTDDGKILNNFESPEECVSYYKLLSGGKINMYTEEGEEFGIILTYKFVGDNLYIGEVEYTPYESAEEKTTADGASSPEDYPDVSYENPTDEAEEAAE